MPPPLDRESRCVICDRAVKHFATARVLNRHDVRNFACKGCGFVQTETPYWLEEAYASAIAPIDIGPLDRALRLAEVTRTLAVTFLDPWRPCLDFGVGYGLLVRRLRDLGLDFRYFDTHCENLFAAGFDASPYGDERFELVTTFEVVEHLEDPAGEASRLMKCTSNFFSRPSYCLLSGPCPEPGGITFPRPASTSRSSRPARSRSWASVLASASSRAAPFTS